MDSLETKRLLLKPLDRSFCSKTYLKWINDENVIRYMDIVKGSSLSDLESYLFNIEKNKIFSWALILRDSKKHIGNIKIDPISFRNGFGEYGIMIGDKNSWGRGYSKEASVEVINYCFNKLNLRKINLGVLSKNVKAIRLYDSLGFIQEGIFKQHKIFDGGYCDEIRMSIFNK